ncbi:hypothetical protein [Candidatus Enterococcus clewellii]|uniref:Uncharacterized protein n=1 Tax=Candidatus Enterococcus clewellii TaxID=1834193 RepID=A0A242K8T2_9ENTE|nr:hypothetical protein [Enterococcus sp. 9E7_DIV0242]OTP17581.1 hypothetical protein A5888_001719 [Enterococcus sp. 9E7_DIV0242]
MATPSKTRSQILNGWGTADSGPINPQETIFSANIRALVESTKWIDEGIDSITTNAENDILTIVYANGSTQTVNLPKYVETVEITEGVITFKDVSGNVLAVSPKFATFAELESEATDRKAADIALAADLAIETKARQDADTALQEYIDDEIATEKAARKAADTTLQENIDAEAATRKSADDAEATTRKAADDQLAADLAAEATARSQADVQLQANINDEAAERIAEDGAIRSELAQETTERKAADTELQTKLIAEETARTQGDADLQTQIDTFQDKLDAEETARVDGDETLQTGIDTINSTLSSYSDRLDKIEAKTQVQTYNFDDTNAHVISMGEISFITRANGSNSNGYPTIHLFARNDTENDMGIGFAGYVEYDGAATQQTNSDYSTIASGSETNRFDIDNIGLGYGSSNELGTINFTVATSVGSVFKVLVTCPSFGSNGVKTVAFTVQRISDVIVS